MNDPVADAARSAAVILVPDLGQHLPVEVEAALAARAGDQRPDRYLDPVSLGSLLVSIATLAWTIYNDQRSRRHDQSQGQGEDEEAEAEFVARQTRVTLREQDIALPTGIEHITEVVATEIIRQSRQPKE